MATSLEDLHLRLQLVPLDTLQALSVSAEVEDEQSALVAPMSVSCRSCPHCCDLMLPNSDGGVTAYDVGIRLAAEQRIDLPRRLRRAEATGKVGEIVEVELEDDTTEDPADPWRG